MLSSQALDDHVLVADELTVRCVDNNDNIVLIITLVDIKVEDFEEFTVLA